MRCLSGPRTHRRGRSGPCGDAGIANRFEWLASATDKAREQADERLEVILGQIEELGTQATGTVGADDPLLAFEDALAAFSADHILVGLRAPHRADWQERGLLDELLRRFESR